MSNGSLVLFPQEAALEAPTFEALAEVLRAAGVLGSPIAGGEGEFLAGEGFLQQITFMGCSPFIALEPPADGGAFCHLRLHGPYAEPRLLWGRNTRPPKCPACGRRIADWQQHLGADAVHCAACGAESRLADCAWRGHAGFGRCFVEIRNIFPGEAVPVDRLLARLQGLGAGPWGWFYLS